MKILLFLLLLSVLVVPVAADQTGRYVFAGISAYDEIEQLSAVKTGLGVRAGGGIQVTDRFGVELFFDNTTSLDPPKAEQLLQDNIQELIRTYRENNYGIRIEPTRIFSISVLGTLTLPMKDRRSWLFKFGYSIAALETSVTPFQASALKLDDNAGGFTVAGGLMFRWNERWSTEFLLSHTTGDAKSLGATVVFKHQFPRRR